MREKRKLRVLINRPPASLNLTKTLLRAYRLRKHKDNQSSQLFAHDRTFWYGLLAIAVTAATILWLRNAHVHGSKLIHVAQALWGRYQLAGILFLLYLAGVVSIPLAPVFIFALTLPQGPAIMTALALFANLLGSLTSFYLARRLGHDWAVRETSSGHAKKLRVWFDANGPVALMVFGILPIPGFDVLAVFAGLSDMDVGTFLLYSIVGRAVHFAILAVVALKVFGI